MHDWVEVLRSKLREMRILSPNENMYSKMPEMKPILLPTRDPTSPLPAPPPVPAISVPGVEPVPIGLNNITSQTPIISTESSQNIDNNIFTYDDFSLENISENSLQESPLNKTSEEAFSTNDNSSTSKETVLVKSIKSKKHPQPVISIDVNAEPDVNPSLDSVQRENFEDPNDISNVTILDTSGSNPVSFLAGCNSLVTIDTLNNSESQFKLNNSTDCHLVKNIDFQISETDASQSFKNITSLFVSNSKKNG